MMPLSLSAHQEALSGLAAERVASRRGAELQHQRRDDRAVAAFFGNGGFSMDYQEISCTRKDGGKFRDWWHVTLR